MKKFIYIKEEGHILIEIVWWPSTVFIVGASSVGECSTYYIGYHTKIEKIMVGL